jgi:hypothetical protein
MTGPEVTRCARHPDVVTTLRCGKCGTPICPKCMVQTPVGARCPECAKLYKLPTYRMSSGYYLRAIGVAVGMAVVIGAVWGIIESFLPFRFFTLIVGAGIGYAIGEVVSLSVNRKRGTPLAVIGSLGVVVSYIVTFAVETMMPGYTSFGGLGILFTLLAVAIGIYIAVTRLR